VSRPDCKTSNVVVIREFRRLLKDSIVAISKSYAGISLEILRKTTNSLSKYIRGRNSKLNVSRTPVINIIDVPVRSDFDCAVPVYGVPVVIRYLPNSSKSIQAVCLQPRTHKLLVLINHAVITVWSVLGEMDSTLDYLITRTKSRRSCEGKASPHVESLELISNDISLCFEDEILSHIVKCDQTI
jgi:hypothetical protein